MVSFLMEIIGLTSSEVDELKAEPPAYDILGVLADTLPVRARHSWPSTCRHWRPRSAFLYSCSWVSGVPNGRTTSRSGPERRSLVPDLVVLPGVGHEAIDATPQVLVRELGRFLFEG